MKKTSILAKKLLISLLVISVVLGSVIAAHIISGGNPQNIVEDVPSLINITITNSDVGADANITKVNITHAVGVVFTAGTNGSSVRGAWANFTSTPIELVWTNATNGVVIAGSGAIQSFWFNVTVATPGIYVLSVGTTNNTGGFTNYTLITLNVNDTTKPSAVSFATAPSNGYNSSTTFITTNVSVVDNGAINTVTINLYNSTALRNSSRAVISSSLTGSYFVNFTSLPDDIYYINATANDSFGNFNNTETRTIIVDTTDPAISITKSASGSTSLVLTATITDLSGLNATCLINRAGFATISGTGFTQTIAENNLVCYTAYTYTVTCSDTAGRTNTTSAQFSTDTCYAGGSGSSSSSSSSSSSATTSTTYVAPAADLVSGFQRELSANDKIQVAIGSSTHSVTLVSSSSSSATITVASTPVTATLSVGETKKFDSTSDGYYDLAVTLVSLSSGKATISVRAINEQIPAVSQPVVSQPEVTTPAAAPEQAQQPAPVSEPSSSGSSSMIITIIIVVVVVIVLFLVFRPKKRK